MIKISIGNGFWVRIAGYGFNIINREKYPPPFSIRHGYRKELRFFAYGISILRPSV